MKRAALSLASGVVFGFGLALSGMTHADKVLDFLDPLGGWDPSLAFVMGGAVAVTLLTFPRLLRRPKPAWDTRFHVSPWTRIDAPLIAGSLAFGVGWGISGYCPGPAIALLASPNAEAAVFLPALLAGTALVRLTRRRAAPAPVADPGTAGCG